VWRVATGTPLKILGLNEGVVSDHVNPERLIKRDSINAARFNGQAGKTRIRFPLVRIFLPGWVANAISVCAFNCN
jgi:hypothetical protein